MSTPSSSVTDVSPAMPDGRRRLSVNETAAIIGVSPRSLRTYIKNDEVPYRKLGGGYWFLWPDDINTILGIALKNGKDHGTK